jgi:hypothetical protein
MFWSAAKQFATIRLTDGPSGENPYGIRVSGYLDCGKAEDEKQSSVVRKVLTRWLRTEGGRLTTVFTP